MLETINTGKTARKRLSGAPERNAANKLARVAWQHDSNCRNETFPRHTCNGKKNRYHKQGKSKSS